MDNKGYTVILIVLGVFAVFVLTALIKYLVFYFDAIKFAKMEKGRSFSRTEYYHWKRELFALRMSLLPGLNPDRVKAIRLFFTAKGDDGGSVGRSTVVLLLITLMGILICGICLAGGTFAWFSATQSAPTQAIQAARYSATAVILDGDEELVPSDGKYILEAKTYTLKLKASGDASTGYCILRFFDAQNTYNVHTKQFPSQAEPNEKELSLTLDIKEGAILQIIPQWGSSSSKDKKLESSDTYTFYGRAEGSSGILTDDHDTSSSSADGTSNSAPETERADGEEVSYTIKRGDTLSGIASKFGTSVKKLTAYNGIADPDNIVVGNIIKIPPEGYKLPQATTSQTTSEEGATSSPNHSESTVPTETNTVDTELTAEDSVETDGTVFSEVTTPDSLL